MTSKQKQKIEHLRSLNRFHTDPIFAGLVVDLEKSYNHNNQLAKDQLTEVRDKLQTDLDNDKEYLSKQGIGIYNLHIKIINEQINKLK